MSRYLEFVEDSIAFVENTKSPRIIKTHLPLSMLPPNLLDISKVVVVARNVKDVCVSFYHMEQMSPNLGLPKDTIFDDYIDFFISGRPAIYGDYWSHLKVLSFKGIYRFIITRKFSFISINIHICLT